MSFLKKSYQFLNTNKFNWTLIVTTIVFTIVFLFFFLPFGVNEPKKEINLRFLLELSLFSIPIFIGFAINEFLLRKRLKNLDRLGNYLFYVIWVFIFTGSLTFLLYNYLQSWYDFKLKSYLLHVPQVSSIFVFPLIGCFVYFNSRRLASSIKDLSEYSNKKLISIPNSTGKTILKLEKDQVLYFEAQDNYVKVFYFESEELKSSLLRNTLSNLENDPKFDKDFLRFHRSYLVNKYFIESISGTSLKSEIKIRHNQIQLPVSRKMIPEIRSYLNRGT